MRVLIITDGLIHDKNSLLPHSELEAWQRTLARARRRWFQAPLQTPLQWYMNLQGWKHEPAAMLAAKAGRLPAESRQCWVASPYHAVVMRDRVRVLPDSLFEWCEEDAQWLAGLLNPLLDEDGMQLIPVGAALLVLSAAQWQVQAAGFADIEGGLLPDRHPPGKDGGRMMRLLSEIQMMLLQNPARHRQKAGHADIHGLWLWGACILPHEPLPAFWPPVVSDDPVLASLVDHENADIGITYAGRLAELLEERPHLPSYWLLAGAGAAVLMDLRGLPHMLGKPWQPKYTGGMDTLLDRVRSL